RTPQSRHGFPIFRASGKSQGEKFLCLAIHEDLRCVVVNFDQIAREPMGAINVVDQVRELIARDCLLVMFENIPSRLATKNADVVRGMKGQRTEQKNE